MVVIPIGSKTGKAALILTLTTLVIGFGASVSIASPSADEVQDGITINASNDNNADWIDFQIDGPNSDSSNETGVSGQDYVTYDFTAGNNDYGDYTITVEDPSGTDTVDLTIDGQAPTVTFPDLEYVSDDPTITVDVDDTHTGVKSVEASIGSGDAEIDNVDDGGCDGSSECESEIEIDTGNMDEGDEFDLDVTVNDSAGNSDTNNEDGITLDDSYDGDSSADVEWDVSGDTTLIGNGDDDQDVLISFQPDTVSDTTVYCMVDGEDRDEATDTDTLDASDEEEEASCEFDSGEYAGSVFDLAVEVEDAAGNEDTVVEDQEMVWDERPPAITTIENPNDISTFNENFELSVTATDDASGVENLEYYFESSTSEGNGESIDLDQAGSTAVDSTFEVSPNLGRGNHTVYVRARDGTNQWSDSAEFDFEYFPNRDPEVDLQAPESVEVTSGGSTSFTLTIENGAPFFLNGVEVNSDSVLWNGTVSASNLEEGGSVEKTVNIEASGLEPDLYNLSLETASMDDTTTVEVVVRATGSQQSDIQQQVDGWASKMEELESNVSSLGSLSDYNQKILDGNVSEFKQKVQKAQSAVESGEYYRAKSNLQNIDTEFQEASSTFSDVKQEYSQRRTNRYIMYTFIAVLVIGGGTAGFLLYREEELIGDSMDLSLPETVMAGGLPELGISEKISGLFEEEEEEEVGYSFEDFT